MIKRCTKSLEGYEEKLHLIAKFQSAKQKVAQIDALAKEFHSSHNEAIMEEIGQISNQILEEPSSVQTGTIPALVRRH